MSSMILFKKLTSLAGIISLSLSHSASTRISAQSYATNLSGLKEELLWLINTLSALHSPVLPDTPFPPLADHRTCVCRMTSHHEALECSQRGFRYPTGPCLGRRLRMPHTASLSHGWRSRLGSSLATGTLAFLYSVFKSLCPLASA